MTYTIMSDATREIALGVARGRFQLHLVYGSESWSGSTLSGRASSFGGRYRGSRDTLMRRMQDAGLLLETAVDGATRRKVLHVARPEELQIHGTASVVEAARAAVAADAVVRARTAKRAEVARRKAEKEACRKAEEEAAHLAAHAEADAEALATVGTRWIERP